MNNSSTDPLISVIIPIYNVDKYLAKCIDSVLYQIKSISGVKIEIILVNDGSIDKSKKICEQYVLQYPFILLINKKNGGLSDARNTGIKAANGEWIMFLDGDDYWNPNWSIKNMVSILQNNQAHIIIGNYEINYNGCEFRKNKSLSNLCGYHEYKNLRQGLKNYLQAFDQAWAVWKIVIRNEFLIKNNLFFKTEIFFAEDVLWIIELFKRMPKVYYLDNYFYVYRENRQGSLSNERPLFRIENIIKIFDIVKNNINLNQEDQEFVYGEISNCLFTQFIILGRYNKDLRKQGEKLINTHVSIFDYVNLNKKFRILNFCRKYCGAGFTLSLLHIYFQYFKK